MRTNSSVVIVTAIIALLSGCQSAPPVKSTKPVQVVQPRVIAIALPATKPTATVLKFSPASINSIEAGTKTSTTRKGVRVFPGDIATAIGGGRTLHLEIISAVKKTMNELTESEATSDGSDSLDALKTALRTNYPGINADDVITVVTFRLAKSVTTGP